MAIWYTNCIELAISFPDGFEIWISFTNRPQMSIWCNNCIEIAISFSDGSEIWISLNNCIEIAISFSDGYKIWILFRVHYCMDVKKLKEGHWVVPMTGNFSCDFVCAEPQHVSTRHYCLDLADSPLALATTAGSLPKPSPFGAARAPVIPHSPSVTYAAEVSATSTARSISQEL